MICDLVLTEERKSVERSLATRVTCVQQRPFCKLPIGLIHNTAAVSAQPCPLLLYA